MPYDRAARPSRWRATPLPRGWARLRRVILARDLHTCQIAGPRCLGDATEVDHIEPGDNHDPSNLQAVCGPCHATKTGKENAARTNGPSRHRAAGKHPGLL